MIASLILLLHLMGTLSLESAVISLCVTGAMLIIAEIAIVSFGLLALNALLAFYAAFTLHMGEKTMMGLDMGWPVLFGIAFVEIVVIITVIAIHMWIRSRKTTTGSEGMIGATATIISWSGKQGTVNYEGEIWKAKSESEINLTPNEDVIIDGINKLHLMIRA